MRQLPPIAVCIVATLVACARPIRAGAIIDLYTRADCVPVNAKPPDQPDHARAWSHPLTLRDGGRVQVTGVQAPGGRIDVKYAVDGHEETAASSGDYIYPADVRFASDLLYVKTSGVPAAFGGPQTWLFEYDLRQRRQTKRVLVDPTVLPPECSDTR
jgi:hypothetical protein